MHTTSLPQSTQHTTHNNNVPHGAPMHMHSHKFSSFRNEYSNIRIVRRRKRTFRIKMHSLTHGYCIRIHMHTGELIHRDHRRIILVQAVYKCINILIASFYFACGCVHVFMYGRGCFLWICMQIHFASTNTHIVSLVCTSYNPIIYCMPVCTLHLRNPCRGMQLYRCFACNLVICIAIISKQHSRVFE